MPTAKMSPLDIEPAEPAVGISRYLTGGISAYLPRPHLIEAVGITRYLPPTHLIGLRSCL